jgi:hypothetical protein
LVAPPPPLQRSEAACLASPVAAPTGRRPASPAFFAVGENARDGPEVLSSPRLLDGDPPRQRSSPQAKTREVSRRLYPDAGDRKMKVIAQRRSDAEGRFEPQRHRGTEKCGRERMATEGARGSRGAATIRIACCHLSRSRSRAWKVNPSFAVEVLLAALPDHEPVRNGEHERNQPEMLCKEVEQGCFHVSGDVVRSRTPACTGELSPPHPGRGNRAGGRRFCSIRRS